ncbi:hypothetical protein Q4493_04700 [Colwellia sp. 1_MG-2023]|uniref:hypothetical protein n=1 Tax=Colwellia sp. 1_MG-2023 TaxID=3062649 RepID=UPI0026E14696|nr:hypothetical protein [Colwellia sp. 1_MG-2023]MDO6445070.1 hypothetical protein [Colwellia sp. 1_MG-2023]
MKTLNRYHVMSVFYILSLSIGSDVFARAFEQAVQNNDKKPLIWLVEDKKENLNLLTMSAPTTSVATYIESRVIGQLKQYDIVVQRMSIKRIEQVLQTTPNACVANRAKLESRQKYSLFSTPQAFYLTHKLFRYNQRTPLDEQLFNADGEITSLKAVFDYTPNEIIGLASGVSFGPFLDIEVGKLAKKNIYFRGGVNRVTALEAMLYANRVDYLLALPIDMKPNQAQKALLEQHAIAGAPPYLIAHISCSKSQEGAAAINAINDILDKMYRGEDYYLAHKKWFPEQDLIKLQRYLKEKFVKTP